MTQPAERGGHSPLPWTVVPSRSANEHLPDFARSSYTGVLGIGMRHIGIVGDGIVLATVWNHHDSTECAANADSIIHAINNIAALERRNAVLVGALTNARNQLRVARDGIDADHPMYDYFVSAIKAADSALAAQER